MKIMATNGKTIKNGACWYGLHFGCLNTTNDPNCTKCAERLANAVNYMAHEAAPSSVGTHNDGARSALRLRRAVNT
ncbi:MAG: hypothetical protein ACXVI8_07735 [Halobacteriota archaeon]